MSSSTLAFAHPAGAQTKTSSTIRNLEEDLFQLAVKDPDRFFLLFRSTRDSHVKEVTRACMRYLAVHGLDQIGQKIRIWLVGGMGYLDQLLDPEFLSQQQAIQVVGMMRDASLPFVGNLQRQLMGGKIMLDPDRLDRAIHILEAVIDPGILIPWLRNLTQSSDPHIRSKAAKTLCAIRPNLMMIERQLKSEDARVRANALEALWSVKSADAARLFDECLTDESHRVVVNALVGLYRLGVASAFGKLLALADDPVPMRRRAAVWGMGYLADLRAVPALRKLVNDSDDEVRVKAGILLATLAPEPIIEAPPAISKSVAEAAPERPVAESVAQETVPATVSVEPAKVEPAKVEPAKVEPAKVEPAKPEESKGGWGRKRTGVLNI